MVTDLDKLKDGGQCLARYRPANARERIREHIDQLRLSFPDVADEEASQLALWFEEVHGVTMRDGAALQETEASSLGWRTRVPDWIPTTGTATTNSW